MKIPFVNMFSQRAMGISLCGNDLIITTIWKKLIACSHETVKVKDFMFKDALQLKHAFLPKENFTGDIILSLPREFSIVREIEYPHANLKELRDALAYQLDSFIPFRNEDVYFDIHSLSHSRQNAKVLIIAMKKEELDNVLSRLQALGITPTRVIITPFAFLPIIEEKMGFIVLVSKTARSYSYNLYENNCLVLSSLVKTETELAHQIQTVLPEEILLENVSKDIVPQESKIPTQLLDEYLESYGAAQYGLSEYPCNLSLISSARKRLNPQTVLMFVFMGFLICFAFLIPYIRKVNNLAMLETVNAQIRAIKRDVSVVEKLQERIAVLDKAVSNILEVKGTYIPRIDVILELAKDLPGNAWAKAVTIVDDTFEVEGDAVSSTNLIPILENSPLFSGVGLASPVTKTQNGREKFRIKGNIKKE
ncbi:MAG: hypothetical protein DCC43_11620 [Candidatus Brocadia sp.]|nr:hypothetical protein [Candidatus Brocadia fulgida]MCC6325345.1 pilus assembly protein PilM [Candidatus Brocadia sp.]MCE7911657.1 hypothetical protein [Candidatus Brocadia sp. AMX3]MDG5995782.1 hypothetical protein [Candidatus Brocadia sp.]RIJ95409.1 MAG: hypothetical protein DCC43_11620 [Candidatus Brocadia sp.]